MGGAAKEGAKSGGKKRGELVPYILIVYAAELGDHLAARL
jgi:hypothetical protein